MNNEKRKKTKKNCAGTRTLGHALAMNKVVCRYFMHGGEPPNVQLYFTELLDIISSLDAQKVRARMRTHL
jgi:hypothetical protein